MAYTKRNQDGGASNRGDELIKRDKEAAEIRRQKAASRKAGAGTRTTVSSPVSHQAAPKTVSLTRTVELSPYRSQIEQILGSDTDTVKQFGERLGTAIDTVAKRHGWNPVMTANAYTYAIWLVHGNGNVDLDTLDKLVRRTVEKRFATTTWFMRSQLAARGIYLHGTRQPFFKKDYETARQYAS